MKMPAASLSVTLCTFQTKQTLCQSDIQSVQCDFTVLNACRLQELFPANKQNTEHFSKYFNEAGLEELSEFLRVQQNLGTRKELQRELQKRLTQQCSIREVQQDFLQCTDHTITVMSHASLCVCVCVCVLR